ncbi:MAG: DUF4860 domain-containing protein [Cellulosilyticaceae bacterium]
MSRRRWGAGGGRLLELSVMASLFLFFVGMSLLVLVMSAKGYKMIQQNSLMAYQTHTPIAYIRMKIRQHDRMDGVAVKSHQGQPILVLREEVDGVKYETWIYVYDNYLRELYIKEGDELGLEAGMEILPLQALKITISQQRLVTMTIKTCEGQSETAHVALRSGGDGR